MEPFRVTNKTNCITEYKDECLHTYSASKDNPNIDKGLFLYYGNFKPASSIINQIPHTTEK